MGCRDQSRVRARWCAAAVIFAVGDLLDAPDKLLRLWENSPKCFAGRPSPPESCPCGPFCPKGIPLLQTNQSPKIKTQSLGFYTIRGILTFLRQARPSMARNKGLPQNLQLHPSNGWVPAALCAQLRQALCLLGIGANIWDKCNLPPAIRYPLLGRNSKSSIAAKFTAEQGLFHRKILVNRSRPPSTAQTLSPPYRRHPFFNSSYNS